jgi:Amt family ammonium transporter
MNGSLTGTVAVSAGCNVFASWAAAIIGLIAGLVYISSSKLLIKLQIDDPVSAVPVNGFGGLLGLLCVPLLRGDGKGILLAGSMESVRLLGWNIVGMLVIITWTGITMGLVFYVLKKYNMLRVEIEDEIQVF